MLHRRMSMFTQSRRTLRACIYALLLALACMVLTPLTAAACGGMFSEDTYTEQSTERLIFAVNPGQVTLYEQIKYTGSPQKFAWVLPLPAVPTISLAPTSLFQTLDRQTAPVFSTPSSDCNGSISIGAGAANTSHSSNVVNVYSSGTVGPFAYDVINSNNPQALTQWLNGHHYKIPAESQAEIQIYTRAHMFFLAMRLHGSAGVQDMMPVKITYASPQSQITIPLRMATPMSKERLGVLVWIFANSRYAPQNYQLLQMSDSQLSADPNPGADYTALVDHAVDNAGGHGFITDYAQHTSNLYVQGSPDLQGLQKQHSYLTRLYTDIAPAQITLDPTFAPQTGLPDVSSQHTLSTSSGSCWSPGVTLIAGLLLATVIIVLLIFLVRRIVVPIKKA